MNSINLIDVVWKQAIIASNETQQIIGCQLRKSNAKFLLCICICRCHNIITH